MISTGRSRATPGAISSTKPSAKNAALSAANGRAVSSGASIADRARSGRSVTAAAIPPSQTPMLPAGAARPVAGEATRAQLAVVGFAGAAYRDNAKPRYGGSESRARQSERGSA